MTDNIVGRIDPNIPQFWVQCEAWSDWPERVLISKKIQGEPVGETWYIPERTCQRVNKPDQFFADDFRYSVDAYRCSVCNFRLDRITNYCPNCGAKVIDKVVEE